MYSRSAAQFREVFALLCQKAHENSNSAMLRIYCQRAQTKAERQADGLWYIPWRKIK